MAQYALPVATVLNNAFTQGAGDGDADVFDEMDEGFGAGRGTGSGPDDATTYWTSTAGTCQYKCSLNTVTDPQVDIGHVVRCRDRKSASGGQQNDTKLTILTGAGATVATQTFTNISEVWTTRELSLSTGQAANVNYAAIDIEVQGTEVGGGSGRSHELSAIEFECPDAPSTAPRALYQYRQRRV